MKNKILLCISCVMISINSFSTIGDTFSIRLHKPEGFYMPNTYVFKILSNGTVGLTSIVNNDNDVYDEQIPSSVQYEGKTYEVVEICDSVNIGARSERLICNNLTNFTDRIVRVGKKFGGTFAYKFKINTLVLPSSIKEIANYAFNLNQYKIIEYDFNKYYEIKHIYANNPIPIEITDSVFNYRVYQNTFLHVPKGSVELYKNAKGWKNFRIINEVIASEETNAELIEVARNMGWINYGAKEMTAGQAAAVERLGGGFRKDEDLTSFNEFKYFTGVKSIGDESFLECTGLTSITFHDGLTSIGKRAFSKCSQLSAVTLPKSLESIDEEAFYGCSSLKSLVISDKITVIEKYTFANCTGLERVSIGKNVKSIGREAFGWGTKMTSFSISSITPPEIVYDAFSNCENVTLYVPLGCKGLYESVPYWDQFKEIIEDRSLGKYTEKDISYVPLSDKTVMVSETEFPLEVIDIPSIITIDGQDCTITRISRNAFENNTELKEVSLPETVEFIEDKAFAGCSNLSCIYVFAPNPVRLISGVKSRTRGVVDITVFEGVDLEKCIVYVPVGCVEKYREADGWKEFSNIVEMEEVSAPINFTDSEVKRICVANWDSNGDGELSEAEAEAVTTLNNAFFQNEDIVNFKELSFFAGLNEIGAYDFTGCTNLSSINLPNSIQSIGYAAFANCYSLCDIDMPQAVESIGEYAFQDCKSLTSITIPSAVSKIPIASFIRCISLQNVITQDNVTTIDDMAFFECSKLSSISLSKKLDRINKGAFAVCSNLSSITLPASLTYIGEQAFAACNNLKSLTIPENVETIGLGLVGRCLSLTTLEVDKNNPYFYSKGNGIVDKRTNMLVQSCKVTEIPTEVEGIGDYGFIFVGGREEVIIPENVKCIGYDAFQDCDDLKRVTIPNAIEFIGKEAFLDCDNLEQVIVLNPVPIAITEDVFQMKDEDNNNVGFTNATLYVPYGSKDIYQNADGWKHFNNIVEIGGPDAIQGVRQSDDCNGNYYDLIGRKVLHLQKGLYIRNGKKVIVR